MSPQVQAQVNSSRNTRCNAFCVLWCGIRMHFDHPPTLHAEQEIQPQSQQFMRDTMVPLPSPRSAAFPVLTSQQLQHPSSAVVRRPTLTTLSVCKNVRALRDASSGSTTGVCCICRENPSVIALVPCHHLCLCADCVQQLRRHHCPYCNQKFAGYARVFLT